MSKELFTKHFTSLSIIFFVAFLVGVVWKGLEVLFYGELAISYVDTIIATILTTSILLNLQTHKIINLK